MKVLVTNDDGVFAEGIKLLVEKLMPYASKITVVAPLTEKSATSHSINIKTGVTYVQLEDIHPGVKTYAIEASPADCVLFATHVLKIDYDVVFSGVNRGYNIADDLIYSGTVAAAKESVLKGKKGVAVSCKDTSFEGLEYFDNVMQYLLKSPLFDEKVVININIPQNAQGIKITHQAKSTYSVHYVQKDDGLYYSMCDRSVPINNEPDGDLMTIKSGYVSITPLTFNQTDIDIYKKYH